MRNRTCVNNVDMMREVWPGLPAEDIPRRAANVYSRSLLR